MRVAIRVDASPEIGLGHLSRCLALGQALRQTGADVVVVSRPLGVDVGAWCSRVGLEWQPLSPPSTAAAFDNGTAHGNWAHVPWRDDAFETATILASWAPSWVIVDHYAWDARWHGEVHDALRCHIVVIDDLADRPLKARLLIDHNFSEDHRAKYQAQLVEADTVILGGPSFALLGPAYATAPRWQPRADVRSIGIFMGGADAANASSAALLACREAGFVGPVEIVSTAANPNLTALQAIVDATPGASLLVGLPDLAGFFARHDVQIGAGGGATWERCCVGVPSIVIETAANQGAVIPALAARGVIASPHAEPLSAMIARLLGDPTARLGLAERARALVDGRGAVRVALRMTAGALDVRPARTDDAATMYAWRNHPATRAVSNDGSSIPFDGHVRWLQGVLGDPNRFLFIGVVGSVDVGVIRFDLRPGPSGDTEAEVSLFLDPALHGLGLGTRLLSAGEREVVRRRGETVFRAVVLDGNVTSRRMFAGQGYSFNGSWWRKRVSPLSPSDLIPEESI